METKNLRIKSIELALQLPDNTQVINNFPNTNGMYPYANTPSTATIKKNTDDVIKDAEKIFQFLTKES